ncbi:MAG: glucose-1-phosphate adenylyltransferase [Clostridia bacterium]|nr:glucose-1-phosphate adenylyltransferase [Clostridia bacterium]
MKRKEMLAMLLAGGQGSRLYVLTQEMAKPAVPFGGKYRIIDFPLSNCTNSGIDTVGVLTQYRPLELHSYIGNGQTWDLNRMSGGVHILPPYVSGSTGEWYAGTANAIYQNIQFIEKYDPEYVLILSGDHVYKMDYSKMLDFHKEKGADATIATLQVPIEEASRFGIINAHDDDCIYEFEEKPPHPKSDRASMGIYIFTWEKLRKYLIEDEADPNSSKDFGKDVLPKMLNAGERMFAYPFEGYWKDVGTIESLWEANMDLLNPHIPLNLADPDWRIYARHDQNLMPQYIGKGVKIGESMITENCSLVGCNLWYSVLFNGVSVDEGTTLNSAVVMQNAKIGKNCTIKYAIIADDAVIEDGAVIGAEPENYDGEWGIAVVGSGAVVKAGQVVKPQEMIKPNTGREEK